MNTVERLREAAEWFDGLPHNEPEACLFRDAAIKIERLQAAVDAVPRILYGLALIDPRQARLAQEAIDVCRSADGRWRANGASNS